MIISMSVFVKGIAILPILYYHETGFDSLRNDTHLFIRHIYVGFAGGIAMYTYRFLTENDLPQMETLAERVMATLPDKRWYFYCEGDPQKWLEEGKVIGCLEKEKLVAPTVNHRNLHIDEKELEAIMLREFGPIRRPSYRLPQVTEDMSEKKSKSSSGPGEDLLIVDGYNVIFAWDDLKALAKTDLGGARHRLCEILSNYSSFRRIETVLVFDGYLVAGNPGEKFDHDSVHVIFTKENETGDIYIEKLIGKIGKNDRVRVVTSDGLIQLSAIRNGILRMSAAEFEQEIDSAAAEISDYLKTLGKEPFGTVTVPETENKNKEG